MLSHIHRWSFHLAISLNTEMARLQTAPAVLAGSIVMCAQAGCVNLCSGCSFGFKRVSTHDGQEGQRRWSWLGS